MYLTDILKKEYPFLAESDNGKVLCTVCRAHFSKDHGGRSDITQHIVKKKHKEAVHAGDKFVELPFFAELIFSLICFI